MSEEIETNNDIQKEDFSENNNITDNDILNSDFFKLFETPQKLQEKRENIINLINYLTKNQTYIQSLKETKRLELLYEIILTNLIENNNNFLIVHIDLIKIMSEQISTIEKDIIKNGFINFFKKALPKLFDKLYLQNEKIIKNLLELFIFVVEKNLLKFGDYFPFLENIYIEEDEVYKINIMNFLVKLINTDEKIYKEDMPVKLIELIEKLSQNKDNQYLKEIAGNIMNILNSRKKEEIYCSNNNTFEIPNSNSSLSQQDSKLAFSSFIKKISKAIREENLNKNINKEDKSEQNISKEEIKENNSFENGQIEKEKKESLKEEEKDNINDNITTNEKGDKNEISENNEKMDDKITNKEMNNNPKKPKRIINHIKRDKSNEIKEEIPKKAEDENIIQNL